MALPLVLIVSALSVGCASASVSLHPGQSIHKEEFFQRELEREREELTKELEKHPDFELPYIIPTSFYREREELGYTQNLLVDPCKGNGPGCCEQVYGTPEYREKPMDATSRYADGTVVSSSRSRWPANEKFFDRDCVEEDGKLYRLERRLFPDGSEEVDRVEMDPTDGEATCLEHHIGRQPTSSFPVCWDFNSSVVSTESCFDPNGTKLPTCITLGYTQNAFIPTCGNEFASSRSCGSFIELHRKGDDRIVAETRLPPDLVTGYITTTISLNYFGDPKRVICRGDYELWWVLRTRTSWVVEMRKPFFVELPECEFDIVAQRYKESVAVG